MTMSHTIINHSQNNNDTMRLIIDDPDQNVPQSVNLTGSQFTRLNTKIKMQTLLQKNAIVQRSLINSLIFKRPTESRIFWLFSRPTIGESLKSFEIFRVPRSSLKFFEVL